MAKHRRPDNESVTNALRVVRDVFTSPAMVNGLDLTVRVHLTPDSGEIQFNNPDPRIVRDLLVAVRKFDMRTDDANLERMHLIAERIGVKPDWLEGLAGAKAHWASRFRSRREIQVQQPGELTSTDAERTWIGPHEAFELWIYGEVIHDDYEKELKWKSLWLGQAFVRIMAHDYLNDLLDQANFLGRLLEFGLIGTPDPPASPLAESSPAEAPDDQLVRADQLKDDAGAPGDR